MVLRTAARGRYAGQQFWGCTRFPQCRGVVAVAAQGVGGGSHDEPVVVAAGSSAQAEFERRRQRRAERVRRTLPAFVGVTVVVMLLAYLVGQSVADARWGATAAGGVALLFLFTYLERPQTIEAWRIGAEGERKTGRHLAGLVEAGFVVLHDRKVPGYGGNLDHIVIGPTGVWAVETKNLAGKVVIDGDSLRIGGRRQDKIVDQVYREAAAIQVALATSLRELALTVTPVICLHRGELPFFNKTVRGVRLASGRQLERLIRDGDVRLDSAEVQQVADVANRTFKSAVQ